MVSGAFDPFRGSCVGCESECSCKVEKSGDESWTGSPHQPASPKLERIERVIGHSMSELRLDSESIFCW